MKTTLAIRMGQGRQRFESLACHVCPSLLGDRCRYIGLACWELAADFTATIRRTIRPRSSSAAHSSTWLVRSRPAPDRGPLRLFSLTQSSAPDHRRFVIFLFFSKAIGVSVLVRFPSMDRASVLVSWAQSEGISIEVLPVAVLSDLFIRSSMTTMTGWQQKKWMGMKDLGIHRLSTPRMGDHVPPQFDGISTKALPTTRTEGTTTWLSCCQPFRASSWTWPTVRRVRGKAASLRQKLARLYECLRCYDVTS